MAVGMVLCGKVLIDVGALLRRAYEAADDEDAKERPDISGLITEGLDPQLETAVLILQAKAFESTPARTRHAKAD